MMSLAQSQLRRTAFQSAIITANPFETTSASMAVLSSSSQQRPALLQQTSTLQNSYLFNPSIIQATARGISTLQSFPVCAFPSSNDTVLSIIDSVQKEVKEESPLVTVAPHATLLRRVHDELQLVVRARRCRCLQLAKVHTELLNNAYRKQRRQDFDVFHRRFIPVMHEYAHVQWKKYSMTKNDRCALIKYCNSKMFGALNQALRSTELDKNVSLDTKNRSNRDSLLKCMTKRKMQTLQYQGTVFRGVKDLPDSLKKQMMPGGTFADAAFLSTSINPDVAFSQDSAFTGSVRFVIHSKTGFRISQWSNYAEEEVLFPPQTLFRIQSILPGETPNVQAVITMEEI